MQSDPFDLRLAFDEHGIALKRYRTGENRAVLSRMRPRTTRRYPGGPDRTR